MGEGSAKRSLNQRVGDGVRAELARSGMTLTELAEAVGTSPRTLRRCMNDEAGFKVPLVEAICDVFGIGPTELIRESLALGAVRIVANGEVIVERR